MAVNCGAQPIPVMEQNAPGFYYIVRWRRLAENSTSSTAAAGWGTEQDVQERTIDAATNTLAISGQPVYRPYEMVVLAANEMGEAASRPRPVVGYSSEAGTLRHHTTQLHFVTYAERSNEF